MKKISILTIAVLLAACSYNTGTYNGWTYTFDTPVKTIAERQAKAKAMYEAEQARIAEEKRLAEEKAKAEAEAKKRAEQAAKEKKEQEEKAQKKAAFDKAYPKLLNGKCSTDKWNSYEFGKYFTDIANKNKITPWKVYNGTAYERRNIPSYEHNDIWDNYMKFSMYHIPEDIKGYYEDQDDAKKAIIFNAIIKKYNSCYNQLK